MPDKIYQKFTSFVQDEVKTARYLFLMVGIGFLSLGIWGKNITLKFGIDHAWINLLIAFYSLVLFGVLTFYQKAKEFYKELGYSLIYLLNIGNIFILIGTTFLDQCVYQFILVFTISAWFFRTQRAYIMHFITINVLLLFSVFINGWEKVPNFDFFGTHFIAAFAQLVLIRYRFGIEDRLSESEKQYRLLAEHSFDLVCIHSAKGEIQFISPSVKRLLGYSPEEMVGKRSIGFVHPDEHYIIKGLRMDDPTHPSMQLAVQYRLRTRDGSYVWFETVFVPFEDNNDISTSVLSQSREIGKRRQAQVELEERTKELERSNADLETFAFVSSHDMQEPLRMISNYTQLLKKRYVNQLDQEAQEYLDYAHNGAVNLSQLIRDLLHYSRITRDDVEHQRVNVNNIMKQELANLSVQISERKAEVTYEDLPDVIGDYNLLLLVFQNLISNSIKYNTSESPTVKVGWKKMGGKVEFYIQDNGIGIAPEHQAKIFEPFHRLHTKAAYPGTGLGLSICRKIVERHEGKIRVESKEGEGTTFYFTLPAA